LFGDHVPASSAPAVLALEAAGWSVVGKTNLHEFAYGTTEENPHFGVVPNPLASGSVAGGSSGGNAAALVLGAADLALADQDRALPGRDGRGGGDSRATPGAK
jgi:aspartyl-tRNA(Asn)/glutamyl-tRNA(Gln) amidotransferase subunit A